MSYQEQLKAVNERLGRVKLRPKGERLYLRGTFPPKPEHDKPRQYELTTGYRAVPKELRLAEAFAQEIESLLIRDKFDWNQYLKPHLNTDTIGHWIEKLETDRWSRHPQNENTLNTWKKSYKIYLDKLPKDAQLTIERLKAVIERNSDPGTRTRELYCLSYGVLAKFAGLDDAPLKKLARGRKVAKVKLSDLPTDEQIVAAIQGIPNPAWRWMFGIQATFGLRNHELWRIDLDRSQISEGKLVVGENSKTGSRMAWACPLEWVNLFSLDVILLPHMDTEGKANNALGARVTRMCRYYDLPFTAYALRDAYACRLAVNGVDVSIAARWMGHSITTHCKHYLDALGERHSQEVFEKLNQGN